MKNHRSKY